MTLEKTENKTEATTEVKAEQQKKGRRPYLSGTLRSQSGELLGVLALWVVKPKKQADEPDE